MPAKPSGEVKTRTIRNVQKNGDIYILERKPYMIQLKNTTELYQLHWYLKFQKVQKYLSPLGQKEVNSIKVKKVQ